MSWDDRQDADEETTAMEWLHENNYRRGKLLGFALHEPCGVLIYGDYDRLALLEDHLIWCSEDVVKYIKRSSDFVRRHNHEIAYACDDDCPGYSKPARRPDFDGEPEHSHARSSGCSADCPAYEGMP